MDLLQLLKDLLTFLVIQNFAGLTTIIAGLVALWVYLAQKKDKKINAARVILSEIRNAERKIDELRNSLRDFVNDLPSVLPTNSWTEYSYLFASDFDQDQLEEITAFYGACEVIEEALRKDNNFFWVTTEHRARITQTKLADIIDRSVDKNSKVDSKKLDKLKKAILDTFTSEGYSYSPSKSRTLITNYLEKITKITTTTTGSKLKKIAQID